MLRFLILLIVILAAAFVGLKLMHFEFYPENIQYYIPKAPEKDLVRVEFKNGLTMTGKISEETADSFMLTAEGSSMRVKKTEIVSSKDVTVDPVKDLKKNLQYHWKHHPLIKRNEQKARQADEAATGVLSTLSGAEHLKKFDEVKEKIGEIEKIKEEREQMINDMFNQ